MSDAITKPAFLGLEHAENERLAAQRFVEGVLKRKRLTEETIDALHQVLADIRNLPGKLPATRCEITVACGYGDEDVGGTEFHTFILDREHFELVSGGTSYSAPVGQEEEIDAFRFAAEADGNVMRKMDVLRWIAEVEECASDPGYKLSVDIDEGEDEAEDS